PGVCASRDHGVRPLTVSAGVQPLNDTPVDPERCFAQRRPEQLDAASAPLVRHGRAHPEPVRGPGRPESLTEHGRPVIERLRFLPRDTVDRPSDEQFADGPSFRATPCPHLLRAMREAGSGILAVPDQATLSASLATAPGIYR